MGHCIDYGTYDLKVNKSSVQAEWDECAAHEDWREGATGLPGKIRWIDYTCNSREEAEEYIRSHDSGWYDQLAVKFRDTDSIPKSSATKEKLIKYISNYQAKMKAFDQEHSIANLKAELISCPVCKSKLARAYLVKGRCSGRPNGCPVCLANDIRAEYIGKQLAAYQEKINNWQKQLKEEEKRLALKVASKAPVMWLVKVEYHV